MHPGPSVPRTSGTIPRSRRHVPWHPLFAYDNLPPVPTEQLRTDDIEEHCALATAALTALRNATGALNDPSALFETTARVEAQASSAIEGIVTDVGKMLEQVDRPRRASTCDLDTIEALRPLRRHQRGLEARRARTRGNAAGYQV